MFSKLIPQNGVNTISTALKSFEEVQINLEKGIAECEETNEDLQKQVSELNDKKDTNSSAILRAGTISKNISKLLGN